ncbi:hypothetical protein L207DRAFT_443499 [Hyaloscypha variabilis F]|uniref:Zn(2)-C6 fungal-type domain-containing protein n=1 Tax=Hyaloscypha variabilis (strain UAMH 11265 / GT02V1 / F) TaxID=1149755 RepID=A0A2J6QRA0_HYAVF|nr:hypothetical protein L207DRAFT_446604 [Hyaloscypha variabilis F]PMD30505.1 hypothetical protein L207DRAFT_443499 [Hyaloscypha variabilis F]
MPGRRPHSKSRLGCVGCKVRKVKCDEVRPICGRCSKRESGCHYVDNFSNKYSPTALATRKTESPFDFFDDVLPSVAQSPSASEQGTNQTFRDRDLELLHHYSTSTYLTLTNVKSLLELWRVVVPQLAFSHSFLMHGLLAISACHIAHLRPAAAEYYIRIARYHYASAVSLYRPLLNHLSQENGAPVFAFSALLACLAIAMPEISHHQPAPPTTAMAYLTNMFDTLGLIRGVKKIVACTWPWIQDTSVAPLLILNLEMFTERLEFDVEVAIRSLEARIRADAECEELKDEYLDAMRHFRKCYPRGKWEDVHQGIALTWPVLVSDGFFAALIEQRPIPIAILGLWGTVLDLLYDVWWVGRKGRRLVEALSELLPPGWESLMKWARMRVDEDDSEPQPDSMEYPFNALMND